VQRVHADTHALWLDPHDSNHVILGCDGAGVLPDGTEVVTHSVISASSRILVRSHNFSKQSEGFTFYSQTICGKVCSDCTTANSI